MSIHHRFSQIVSIIVILTILSSIISLPSASAQGNDGVQRQVNPQTGKVIFIGLASGGTLSAAKALGTSVRPQDPAMALVKRFGPEFGLQDVERDLVPMQADRPENGRVIVRYQQKHQSIPVMGGELIVNTNERGDLYSISGEVSPDLSIPTQPVVDAQQARQTALRAVAKWYQGDSDDFQTSEPELWIYDESLLRPSTRAAELVWRMEVTSANGSLPVRELVLVNAQRGGISLHFNQIDRAWMIQGGSGAIQDPDPTVTPLPTETPLPTDTPEPVVTEAPASEEIPSTEQVFIPEEKEAEAAATSITWYVATTGDDVNSCSTPAAPCRTINGAVDKATDSDLIKVAQGTYTGTGNSPIATISKLLTLSGGWNAGFTTQTGYSTIDGEKTRQGIQLLSTLANATIDHFIIQNGIRSDWFGAGGITNDGVLTLNNSFVMNNTTAGYGGGIYGGNITINNSAIFNNKSAYHGGGINTTGSLNINNSTISNNWSGESGGGVYAAGQTTINSSTITSNHGLSGGGLAGFGENIVIKNSIISDNNSSDNSPDCVHYGNGAIASGGNNIILNTAGCSIPPQASDKFNVNPQLAPFIHSRGYHPLKSTSPAVNAGNSATCSLRDQRGVSRVGICDIGAYEYTTPIPPATSLEIGTGNGQIAPPNELFLLPLQVVSLDIQGTPISGVSVTFTSPTSGPSATFQNGNHTATLSTDANGIATTTIKANHLSGSYSITTSATIGSVLFYLENIAWYVKPTGSDTNDCLLPNTACLTINAALNKADANGTIFVATGIYKGTGNAVLTIDKDIKFSGGWNTSFTTQSEFSTINGEDVRTGILVNQGVTATFEKFIVEHSRSDAIQRGGISNDGYLILKNCEIRYNSANYYAGGIMNRGKLTLEDSLIHHNSGVDGGAIYNQGVLTVTNSVITDNYAGEGAGIYNTDFNGPGNATLHKVFIDQNRAGSDGGGIYNQATIVVSNTSIIRNAAGSRGGGMINHGTATLNNVSVVGNKGVEGGGLQIGGSITLNNSTISENTSMFGGGLYVSPNLGSARLLNTILAGNVASKTGPDCSGTLLSSGYNILGNISSCVISATPGDRVNVNPQLGVFLPSEGYIPLLPTSPAINAGNPATCLATDQRGIARPQGAKCDIGAYEYTVPGPFIRLEIAGGDSQLTLFNQAFRKALQIAALDEKGSPVGGVSVKFQAPLASPSGIFAGTGTNAVTVVTNLGGVAQPASFTADGTMGTYNVIASATGVPSRSFALHNGPWLVVPPSNGGNDNNDCMNLGTACASLSGVLSKMAFQEGDPAWISLGTYGSASDQAEIRIDKAVNVYGGWNANFTTQIGTSVIQDTLQIEQVARMELRRLTVQNTGYHGIANGGNLTVKEITIRNNPGTGIINSGQLVVSNSTITQNGDDVIGGVEANGGIFNTGYYPNSSITILDSTITKNKGDSIAGVGNYSSSILPIRIQNSIVAGNTVLYGQSYSQDCAGKIVSEGFNIIGNANAFQCEATWHVTDLVGSSTDPVDPMLDILMDFGNNRWVYPLKLGSPAIEAGPSKCSLMDQRGASRPQAGTCDIGAYEYVFNRNVNSLLITTYTAGNTQNLVKTKVCDQTDLLCAAGDSHARSAHRYAAGIYNLYKNSHNRNSLDGNGIEILSSVHYGSSYQNALWNGYMMVFGDGYGYPLADDVVAHEFTHGVTQYESNLFYYYQSGAINESFSDLWGEYYDQTNSLGNDTVGVKWLIGEDVSGQGATRSMSNPPAYNDPDKMSSPHYYEGEDDSGGVHTNSGVNNKAVYLMVDGGTFNGKTVAALGWEKTAAIYYEVNTNLLFSGADYSDLYYALQQACTNLIGQKGITAGNCTEVKEAIDAVQMNAQPAPNFNTDAPLCSGITPVIAYADDLETGTAKWSFSNGAYKRWQYDSPYGPYAQSGQHFLYADDYPAIVTDASARLATFVVPNNAYLLFAHAYDFESGYNLGAPTFYNFDGGVLEYSLNGGAIWTDAGPLMEVNGYKGTLFSGAGNPLSGRSAFVGSSHGYISTRLNLASLAGQAVVFRWRMGLDEAGFAWGWWVDNVKVYTCGAPATFNDVANTHWAGNFVEKLYNAGITGGCNTNPLQYCPDGTVTRAQMAVFLLRGIHGSLYNPPPVGGSTGFGDVPLDYWSGAWIKRLTAEGITTGCGSGNYCPESPVTRAQMAVFLLRSKYGASYSPPSVGASTGFSDVPTSYWAGAWIKQLVAEGITSGCSTGSYCPESPVTRAQMAVFLVKTFNLP